jgi:hypothetical protein
MAKPTLFTSPHKTLYYFTIIVLQFVKNTFAHLIRYWYLVVFLLAITVAPRFIEGDHLKLIKIGDEIGYFMLYWIILGVASSIGLGILIKFNL